MSVDLTPYRRIVGSENVTTRIPWEPYAESPQHKACFVVAPEDADEVRQVIQQVIKDGLAIVPAGGGTGYSGGITTSSGQILLDTRRMHRVLDVDRERRLARVQSGITIADLNAALKTQGLWWPHNPDSRAMASVGGAVSVRGIGTFFTKHGAAPDMVYGVTAVLGDGTILTIEPRSRGRATGYNLLQLLLSSEGTLAVITEVILKVWPLPEHRIVLIERFVSLADAGDYVRALLDSGLAPETILVESRNRIENEFEWGKISPDHLRQCLADSNWVVILSFAGSGSIVTLLADAAVSLAKRSAGTPLEDDAVIASYWSRKTEKLSTSRIAIPTYHVADLGTAGPDFVVLERAFREMVSMFQLKEKGIRFYVGWPTGELAFSGVVSYDHHDPVAVGRAREWTRALAREIASRGGTISSILGVGVRLAADLEAERSDVELTLMSGIKRLFDRAHLLNPGKLFGDQSRRLDQRPW